MVNKKESIYNTKTVFDVCGHKLNIMSIENHPFGFVYRLNCRPHCCTHPNGIQMVIGEDQLVEMVQKKIAETKFLNMFSGRYMKNIKNQLQLCI